MRPRVKIVPSRLDQVVEITSKILLFLMWAFTIYAFIRMPEIIPTHFNASGKVDDYGNKMMLFILPLIATIIYFGLSQLNKYPHIFNYPTDITEDNAQTQYTIATRMLRFVKLAILITCTEVILSTYLTAIDVADGLGAWSLPVTFSLFFIPVLVAIIGMFKK